MTHTAQRRAVACWGLTQGWPKAAAASCGGRVRLGSAEPRALEGVVGLRFSGAASLEPCGGLRSVVLSD